MVVTRFQSRSTLPRRQEGGGGGAVGKELEQVWGEKAEVNQLTPEAPKFHLNPHDRKKILSH